MISVGIQQNAKPLTEIHGIISRDKDGNEGIIICTQDGTTYPMLSGNPDLIAYMKDVVRGLVANHKETTGLTFHVVKFTTKELVEDL